MTKRKTPLEVVYLGRKKIAEVFSPDDPRNKVPDMAFGSIVNGATDFMLEGKAMRVKVTRSKINKGHTTKWVLKPIAKEGQ